VAKLRHHTFFSITEINAAIAPLLKQYNARPFQQLPGSRLSQFQLLDKPKLKPLPHTPYQFARWKKAKVNLDYHIALDKHFYSVPYTYLKKTIDCRLSASSIECFYQNQRIAHHKRSFAPGHSTLREHMPPKHLAYIDPTPERLAQWASQMGPHTEQLIDAVIAHRPIAQQGYRACLGILRLSEKYTPERLEKAAAMALCSGALTYQHIEAILKKGLEQYPLPKTTTTATPDHRNVRGQDYFIH